MWRIPEPGHLFWNPKKHVITPLGRWLAQPVGSTSYTKGLHLQVHPHDEEKQPWGCFSYRAQLNLDGTVTWVQWQLDCRIKHDRSDEFLEAGFLVAAAWFDRDPVHCAWHFRDMAEIELRELRRKLQEEQHTIDYLGKLLDSPDEPKTRIVKKDDGNWEHVLYTELERSKYRQLWTQRVQRATRRLTQLKEKHGPRMTQLESIKKQCLEFMNDPSIELFPFPSVTENMQEDTIL